MSDILLNGIIGVCSSVVTWLLAKRKYHAEVDSSIIKNMEQALNFYTKLSDDNKQRLDENQKKLNEVLNENITLKGEIEQLKIQIKFLMVYNCMRGECKKRISNSPNTEESDEDIY